MQKPHPQVLRELHPLGMQEPRPLVLTATHLLVLEEPHPMGTQKPHPQVLEKPRPLVLLVSLLTTTIRPLLMGATTAPQGGSEATGPLLQTTSTSLQLLSNNQ